MGMHNFRELKIWQRSMDFVVKVYETTAKFPKVETYGIVAQLKKSAVSMPSNISEGAGSATNKQFRLFLEYSMGSANEAYTQIELSYRVGYLKDEDHRLLTDEALQIYKMILGFYNTLQN